MRRQRGSHGWRELSAEDKRSIIGSIASGAAPRGPRHLELDLSDRCNVDCYFCNAMDVPVTSYGAPGFEGTLPDLLA